MIAFSENDIPFDIAVGAYRWTSQTPEQRAGQVRQDYVNHLSDVMSETGRYVTPENYEAMTHALERYKVGYLSRLLAILYTRSKIAGQFVTGASGWTDRMVRANDRRNATLDRRIRELEEYSNRMLSRLRRQFSPSGALTETAVEEQLERDNIEYPIGAATVVENFNLNRLQIIFPTKPPEEVRKMLKARGFHWSPNAGAWQRKLNDAARRAAKEVLDCLSCRE